MVRMFASLYAVCALYNGKLALSENPTDGPF
jgi:hypothetical protein